MQNAIKKEKKKTKTKQVIQQFSISCMPPEKSNTYNIFLKKKRKEEAINEIRWTN